MRPGAFVFIKKIVFVVAIISPVLSFSQKEDPQFLENILASNRSLFNTVLNDTAKKEVQILYTQINRNKKDQPQFTSYSYRLDNEHYFYPASTVKLAVSIFALEKLNRLQIAGLSKNTPMFTDSAWTANTTVSSDTSAENGLPSIAHYIKKVLLVSDNDAYNRLYEFVGRAEINDKLQQHGLMHSRIISRLNIGDGGENAKHTNPIRFVQNGKTIYRQPAQYDKRDYPLPLKNTKRGKGYLDNNDNLVNAAFEFDKKNVFPLSDQQKLLKKLMFPNAFSKEEQFNLQPEDYHLLYKYMSSYPNEFSPPRYDTAEYFPAYVKFLYYGAEKNAVINPQIRIFNKVGDSYGYMIDNSYFVDYENKVEFFLSAVVQSNDNDIYNDNIYEYETVCLPFLKNLGQVIYTYELQRKKEHLPKEFPYKP